jgi:hypothetical protein
MSARPFVAGNLSVVHLHTSDRNLSIFQKHWHVFGGKSCHFCRKCYQFRRNCHPGATDAPAGPPLSAGKPVTRNG